MAELETTYSIPPQMENELIRMGILPATQLEELEKVCLRDKWAHLPTDPYDENGKVIF